MTGLKPCPKCGGTPSRWIRNSVYPILRCEDCSFEFPRQLTDEKEVDEGWNALPREAQQTEHNENDS